MSDKKHKLRIRDLRLREPTTLLSDFRDRGVRNTDPPKTAVKPKTPRPREKSTVKYLETFRDYKADPISFSLYIRPNPVLGIDPRAMEKPFVGRVDHGRKKAQMTRPRYVISPGMAVDDIEDDKVRNILITDTYQSSKTRADKVVLDEVTKVAIKAPLGDKYAPPIPVFLPPVRPSVVPPEWRMESRTWDRNALRGFADSTAEFWLKRSKK